MRAILWEAGIVALAGMSFALVANSLSPRGLQLSRNYFPGSDRPITVNTSTVHLTSTPTGEIAPHLAEATQLTQRIRDQGLGVVMRGEVFELFNDPRYAQEAILFVDARDDQHYRAGHIPGALQFDHYRADNFLPKVIPACLGAEKIVIYCTGGDCEDSEFAALMLRDAGIPAERLSVYAGGITEWTADGHPVELGSRNSGQLKPPRQ